MFPYNMNSSPGHFNLRFMITFALFIGVDELISRNLFKEKPQFDSAKIEIIQEDGSVLQFERMVSKASGGNQFSWSGNTQVGHGYLTLAVVDEEIRGGVSSPKSNFQFKGNLNHQTIFSSTPKSRPCGGCKMTQKTWTDPRPRSAAQTKHAWRNADAGIIDLMVVCPVAVRNEIGSQQELLVELANAVTGANLCFRNSQAQIQLRLVHLYETGYSPTSNLDVDLERLTNKNDGFLDEVHSLRDQYGADVVTLLSTDSDMGGLANTLNFPSLSFEDSAFNVCVWDQIGAPVFTLAHEIGHNMGCLHNREDALNVSQSSDYDYGAFAYGKRWFLNGEGYRTVMAYDNSSKSYQNSIPYFSNPAISYLGVPTGNPETENNVMALKISTPYVANFRASKVQGILPSIFSTSINEGNYSTFGVRLSAQPAGQVQINLSLSNKEDFLLGSSSTLTFDQNNWNLRQPVMVLALEDFDNVDESGLLTFSGLGLTSVDVSLKHKDTGTSEKIGQHYFTGTVVNPYGYGLEGVSLSFSSVDKDTMSDENGSFFTILNAGYSGVVTPSKSGYSFSPQSISINSLGNHSTGHTFVASRSSVVYVNQQATGKNDGTSWNDAFTDLTTALATVASFSEVWVAKGIYLPDQVRSASFVLPGDVSILGGFAGGEINSSARDYSKNETILSGDIGETDNPVDNSYHILVPLNGALLDGFIIEEGNATENFTDDRGNGGGLWAEKVAFKIRNCEFRNNWSFQEVNATFENCIFTSNQTGGTGSGGAIWASDSNLTLHSCSFLTNKAGFWGGALRMDDGNLTLSNSLLSGNESRFSNGGGGLYQNAGSFLIKQSSFLRNQATHQGGAILIMNASGSISDSNFTENDNTSSNGGGALFIENSSPTINSCRFIQNKTDANNYGGAIKLVNSNSNIGNCIFKHNQNTVNSGGALYIDEKSMPTLQNNEFHHNSSGSWGGAIFCKSPDLSINGGIFHGNWADYGGGVATNGTLNNRFENIKILGNEANASSGAKGGFLFLGTGTVSSQFVNCVIAGNKSAYRHGVLSPKGSIVFTNCSIYGNQASGSGAVALLFSGNSISLENSILWGNSDVDGYEIYVNTGTASASFSILDPVKSPGISQGTGNQVADPMFVDADGADNQIGTEDDDFRLSSGSPALDAGSTVFANFKHTDIDGTARDSLPDLGAFEYYRNTGPSFITQNVGYTVLENSTLVADLNATDADGDELFFSLVEAEDHGSFSIGSTSGILSFKTAPDFENPVDGNLDNIFNVSVSVSDGKISTDQALEISILDLNETIIPVNRAPEFLLVSRDFTVRENNTLVADLNATDADGDELFFSLVEAEDHGSFSIGSTSGILSFKTAPDFEYPADLGSNNSYNLTLSVSDGNATIQVDVTITVVDLDESAQSAEEAQILVNGYILGNHWRQAGWFGTYYSQFFPWVYHSSMGWLYIVQSSDGNTWMWKESLGWLWTDLDIFPYFFMQSSQQWGYSGSDSRDGQYYLFESGNSGWVDF